MLGRDASQPISKLIKVGPDHKRPLWSATGSCSSMNA